MFYFDHSATTPVHPSVIDLINEVQKDFYANPSSVHSAGKKAKAIIIREETLKPMKEIEKKFGTRRPGFGF